MLNTTIFHAENREFPGWKLKLAEGRGIPTPAVVEDRIFVGGGFGSYDFFSVDAISGALVWHRRTKDDGPTAAVVAGDLAIYNTESCTLEAVDIRSGEPVWSHWLGDPLMAQPAADGNRIYMVYPSDGSHVLGAFELRTGRPLWRRELDHDVITAPVVVDGVVYVSTFDGAVWSVGGRDGRVLWRRDMQATSAPWVYEGEVYVAHREVRTQDWESQNKGAPPSGGRRSASGAAYERTSRFDARGGQQTRAYTRKSAEYLDKNWGVDAKAQYMAADAAVGFGSTPASAKMDKVEALLGEGSVSRAWRYQGSRPVVDNGVLYDTTGDRLEARNAESDEVIWEWCDAKESYGERRLTPPAAANGRVWAGTWDGRIISWDANSGRVRWEVGVGSPCHWQPAIQGGRVYAGLEDGSLVSFTTGDNGETGWSMWGGGPGHNR